MDHNFYVFNFSDESEGGVEVIAHLESNGHFRLIWEGQDIPPCTMVDQAGVPATVVPFCLKESYLLDRSTILRTLYTSFFNRVKTTDSTNI
jgi:hypothetical protein